MTDYLLKNVDVADFETLKTNNCDMLLSGGRIKNIASNIKTPAGAHVMYCHGMLALPGFVDAHTHLGQTFLKGPLDDFTITQWLKRLFTYEAVMDEDAIYHSNLLGCLCALRFGVTTVNDMSGWHLLPNAVRAISDSGIRATINISTTDIAENPETVLCPVDESLRRHEAVYELVHGKNNGKLRASVAPAGLPACSKEMVQTLKAFARSRGLVFHTHLGEGRKETQDVMDMYNLRGECEALYEFGILDSATLLAHSIWLKDFELELIQKTGATPVHCPNTNMKISDGIPPIARMLELGIPVAMGCDGEASSSTRDMIREGRAGAYLQKVVTSDPTVMNAGEVFRMMTINGAKALGYDDLGQLIEGNRADVVLVNMDNDLSLMNPAYRVGNLLYAGDGHAVDTVFCEGELKVQGGRLTDFDEEELLARCRESIGRFNQSISRIAF